MKKIIKATGICILYIAIAGTLIISCKKKDDAKLPTVDFKTGTGYISENETVLKNQILNVGIIADKNEADLRKFEISVTYSYLNNTTTKKTVYINSGNDASHFEMDYEIQTEDQSGTETWKFNVTDEDGNIGEKTLRLTVQ